MSLSDPKKLNLSSLLSERKFKVPDFQRDYVWKQGTEIDEFWDDFKYYFDEFKSSEDDASLFLGTIILFSGKDATKDDGRSEIIDGQQRITTLIIFLIALKHYVTKKQNEEHVIAENKGEKLAQCIAKSDQLINYYDTNALDVTDITLKSTSNIRKVFEALCQFTSKGKVNFTDIRNDLTKECKEKKERDELKKEIDKQIKVIRPVYNFFYDKISASEDTKKETDKQTNNPDDPDDADEPDSPLAVDEIGLFFNAIKKMTFIKWKRLHSLIYFIAPLAAIHYYLLKKADKSEPLIYLMIILFLLIWRIFQRLLRI